MGCLRGGVLHRSPPLHRSLQNSRPQNFPIFRNAPGRIHAHTTSQYTLRQITTDDVQKTAILCLTAFGDKDGARFRTIEQWEKQLSSALLGKMRAQREARIERQLDQVYLLPDSSSSATSSSSVFSTSSFEIRSTSTMRRSSAAAERRAAFQLRQRRRRSFFFCVVENSSSPEKEIVGCVALTLARPEAMMPPPFPTQAPIRCYVSNMAIAPAHRRQGLAKRLIHRCERLVRLWGCTSIWLHVDIENEAAVQLYTSLGYRKQPWLGGKEGLPLPFPLQLPWIGRERQWLLAKSVPPLKMQGARKRGVEEVEAVLKESVRAEGGENGGKGGGVFVWEVETGKKGGDELDESIKAPFSDDSDDVNHDVDSGSGGEGN